MRNLLKVNDFKLEKMIEIVKIPLFSTTIFKGLVIRIANLLDVIASKVSFGYWFIYYVSRRNRL